MIRSIGLRKIKVILSAVLVILVTVVIFNLSRHPSVISYLTRSIKPRPREVKAVWEEHFDKAQIDDRSGLPEGWVLKGKPGTEESEFSVLYDNKRDGHYLHMESDASSASLVTYIGDIDLEATPILRWKWRVITLPEGADGRYGAKDDQAVGIYIGTGSLLSKKTVSYRWDTETPVGSEGLVSYGAGTVKVKWITLRNKHDAEDAGWYVERRNILEDFREAWGFVPKKVYLSVSTNSQYTGTEAEADIDWIELTPAK